MIGTAQLYLDSLPMPAFHLVITSIVTCNNGDFQVLSLTHFLARGNGIGALHLWNHCTIFVHQAHANYFIEETGTGVHQNCSARSRLKTSRSRCESHPCPNPPHTNALTNTNEQVHYTSAPSSISASSRSGSGNLKIAATPVNCCSCSPETCIPAGHRTLSGNRVQSLPSQIPLKLSQRCNKKPLHNSLSFIDTLACCTHTIFGSAAQWDQSHENIFTAIDINIALARSALL